MSDKKRGRPVKPVVMITPDNDEFYFESVQHAAELVVRGRYPEPKPNQLRSVATGVSMACLLPTRKVYGMRFRFATEEEVAEYKKIKGE